MTNWLKENSDQKVYLEQSRHARLNSNTFPRWVVLFITSHGAVPRSDPRNLREECNRERAIEKSKQSFKAELIDNSNLDIDKNKHFINVGYNIIITQFFDLDCIEIDS